MPLHPSASFALSLPSPLSPLLLSIRPSYPFLRRTATSCRTRGSTCSLVCRGSSTCTSSARGRPRTRTSSRRRPAGGAAGGPAARGRRRERARGSRGSIRTRSTTRSCCPTGWTCGRHAALEPTRRRVAASGCGRRHVQLSSCCHSYLRRMDGCSALHAVRHVHYLRTLPATPVIDSDTTLTSILIPSAVISCHDAPSAALCCPLLPSAALCYPLLPSAGQQVLAGREVGPQGILREPRPLPLPLSGRRGQQRLVLRRVGRPQRRGQPHERTGGGRGGEGERGRTTCDGMSECVRWSAETAHRHSVCTRRAWVAGPPSV